LAFFDDKLFLGLCPKILNVARKRLFTSLSLMTSLISPYFSKREIYILLISQLYFLIF